VRTPRSELEYAFAPGGRTPRRGPQRRRRELRHADEDQRGGGVGEALGSRIAVSNETLRSTDAIRFHASAAATLPHIATVSIGCSGFAPRCQTVPLDRVDLVNFDIAEAVTRQPADPERERHHESCSERQQSRAAHSDHPPSRRPHHDVRRAHGRMVNSTFARKANATREVMDNRRITHRFSQVLRVWPSGRSGSAAGCQRVGCWR
jgi:hypothetical protein